MADELKDLAWPTGEMTPVPAPVPAPESPLRFTSMKANADVRSSIESRFSYHPPKGDQPARYNAIREKAKEFAYLLVDSTPFSREQSTALTLLEESVMMANAAIARNE